MDTLLDGNGHLRGPATCAGQAGRCHPSECLHHGPHQRHGHQSPQDRASLCLKVTQIPTKSGWRTSQVYTKARPEPPTKSSPRRVFSHSSGPPQPRRALPWIWLTGASGSSREGVQAAGIEPARRLGGASELASAGPGWPIGRHHRANVTRPVGPKAGCGAPEGGSRPPRTTRRRPAKHQADPPNRPSPQEERATKSA